AAFDRADAVLIHADNHARLAVIAQHIDHAVAGEQIGAQVEPCFGILAEEDAIASLLVDAQSGAVLAVEGVKREKAAEGTAAERDRRFGVARKQGAQAAFAARSAPEHAAFLFVVAVDTDEAAFLAAADADEALALGAEHTDDAAADVGSGADVR